MMLDPAKLAASENRGIFERDPQAYTAYAEWRAIFLATLRAYVELDTFKAGHDATRVKTLVRGVDPAVPRERVFNTVMSDMLQEGASWHHLAALMLLAGYERNPFPHHAGKFGLMISDWILWHNDMLEKARSNVIQT